MSTATSGGQLATRLLTGRWTRAFIVAYFVTMTTLAIWTVENVRTPWPTIVGLVLFAVACAILTLDVSPRLSMRSTLIVAGIGVVNCILISWQLTAVGHSQWYFGAGTVAMFFVSLRGRIALAWVGFAAMAAVIVVWGATSQFGLEVVAMIIGRQAPIVLVGTLFAAGLRRTAGTIDRLIAETSLKATAEAVAEATREERSRRLASLNEFATPLLARLVAGQPIAESERLEFAAAEAALRDGLRARALAVPAVVGAARAARGRGVEVLLLDDSAPGDLSRDDIQRAAAITAAALDAAADGTVTARLLPPGRANIATVVVDGSVPQSFEVARSA